MPIDIQKLFGEQLPAAMKAHPTRAKAIGNSFLVTITGPTGGTWFIDATARSVPSCRQVSGVATADCSVQMSDVDFQALANKPAQAIEMVFSGKIQLGGNPMLAVKFQQVLDLISASCTR